MPPPRVAPAVLAAVALVATPAQAARDAAPVRLSWVRGPGAHGCSAPQRIAEQVAARLGRSPFAGDAARSIDVYLTGGERGMRAEIFVRGQDGQLAGSRELTSEAADCATLEAAAVLALALAIDPDAVNDGGLTRPSGALPPPKPPDTLAPRVPLDAPLPAPLPVWVPPPSPSPEPAAPARGVSSAALRAGAGIGLLPRVAASFSLAVEVAVARAVQITGGALWMPEVRAADTRFAFGLGALALGACAELVQRARVDLAACGAVWGGALHAVVFDLTPVDPGEHPWAAAEASSRLRVRIAGPLHAEVGVELLVPLVRPPFTMTGVAAPVFQQAPVTLLPFAGLGALIP